jgi:hypothetical protein
MQKQLNLFQTVNEAPSPLLRVGAVMRSAFVETHKWQEFHENGKLWIDGEIAVVSEMSKHLYDYRTGFKGYEGKFVCRIGVWTKYFDNGQIAWQLDYGDGTHDYKSTKSFPSFRKDGTFSTKAD